MVFIINDHMASTSHFANEDSKSEETKRDSSDSTNFQWLWSLVLVLLLTMPSLRAEI